MAVSGPTSRDSDLHDLQAQPATPATPVCSQHREALYGVRKSRKGREKGCKWVRLVRGPGGSFSLRLRFRIQMSSPNVFLPIHCIYMVLLNALICCVHDNCILLIFVTRFWRVFYLSLFMKVSWVSLSAKGKDKGDLIWWLLLWEVKGGCWNLGRREKV